MTPAFQPLDGIRVLDFTRVLAGPYATMALAEMGADVIKIEKPGAGDETRAWGPPFVDESSAYFHAINRGKRSVTIDLSTDDGLRDAFALMESVDVVIENFRPGVMDRLGLGADAVLERFPHIVYASITGFGSTGPMSAMPGTEVIVEAESGLMNITGTPEGEPMRFGVAMVDIATGLSMTNGVLAALLERTRTGCGGRIDASLYATAISALGTVVASASAGGSASRAWGSAHPSIVPYRAFATQDGYVVLGATNDPMYLRLVAALDMKPELGHDEWQHNAQRVVDRDRIESTIQKRLSGLTTDDVIERLRRHRVLVAPVRTPEEAARSAQAVELGLVTDDEGVLIPRSPLGPNGTRQLPRAPAVGEHTGEVFAEFGVGSSDRHAERTSAHMADSTTPRIEAPVAGTGKEA